MWPDQPGFAAPAADATGALVVVAATGGQRLAFAKPGRQLLLRRWYSSLLLRDLFHNTRFAVVKDVKIVGLLRKMEGGKLLKEIQDVLIPSIHLSTYLLREVSCQ